jgi:hypothetical protein
MKFKKGDKVVCINNEYINGDGLVAELEINKSYTVKNFHNSPVFDTILLEELDHFRYNINKFISLEEFRILKIQKIRNEIQKRR